MKTKFRAIAAATALAGACAGLLALSALAAPPLSGAIFTTDVNGSIVNGNVNYADKCDVYLDGGPGPNAPQKAAGLPDGDYYFQVTDPSGKTLLSTDAVSNRRITVAGGIIVATSGTHGTSVSLDHGGITIQLCPYLDTPNNGGVYKAWVTPVGDGTLAGGGFVGDTSKVDNPCGNGCFHGFLPARSKTDNFKVKSRTVTFCLNIYKETIDKKTGLTLVSGWRMDVTDPLGVTNTYYTDADGLAQICGLLSGNYSVTESLIGPDGKEYQVFEVDVNGSAVTPIETAVVPLKRKDGTVLFVNEMCPNGVCSVK